MAVTGSSMARRISSGVTTVVLGIPDISSRPRISAAVSLRVSAADPTTILVCSAVGSPMAMP